MQHALTIKELSDKLRTFPRKTAYLAMLHKIPFCPDGHFHITKSDIDLLGLDNSRIPDNDVLYYADEPYGY